MSPSSSHPYVAVCPYLPLAKPITFGGWWLGPLASFTGPWASPELAEATRRFLACFRDSYGNPIEHPSLLARVESGVDGVLPIELERKALAPIINFVTIDANPYWSAETQMDGWSIATTDNADLWLQPLDAAEGFFAVERGLRLRTTAGGLRLYDADCRIPPPLELHLPSPLRLDQDLAEACFDVLTGRDNDRANQIAVAIRWVAKAWANSVSISWEDRIIFLKITSEGLSGTDKSIESADVLRDIYASSLTQIGEGVGANGLLWGRDEPTLPRTWTNPHSGSARTDHLPAFEHWYMALADARNEIVHSGQATSLEYEEGTAYDGPFVEIGDRVLRELIKVSLGLCGHPAVWRRGFNRSSFRAWQRLSEPE